MTRAEVNQEVKRRLGSGHSVESVQDFVRQQGFERMIRVTKREDQSHLQSSTPDDDPHEVEEEMNQAFLTPFKSNPDLILRDGTRLGDLQ